MLNVEKKNELTPGQKKGCFGCLGVFGIIAIALMVVLIVALNNTTKEEVLTEEEKAEVIKIINDFDAKTPAYIAATKGIVKKISIHDVKDTDIFTVNVYIGESDWAKSTESEKASVAATLGRQMEQLAAPTEIYMNVISFENGDTLASPKITSEGYKIIR